MHQIELKNGTPYGYSILTLNQLLRVSFGQIFKKINKSLYILQAFYSERFTKIHDFFS